MKRRMNITPLKTLRICNLLFPVKLNTRLDLVPSLRMSGAIPLLDPMCFHGVDGGNCIFTHRRNLGGWAMWDKYFFYLGIVFLDYDLKRGK